MPRRLIRRIQTVAKAVGLLAITLSLNACAYHLGAVERGIPGGYRSVAIPVFKNATREAGIEVYFTNALIREFQRGQIGQLADRSNAQVTLEGTIDSVTYAVSNAVSAGTPQGLFLPQNTVLNTEYRILLRTTLRLRRNSDQKVIWEGAFNGETSYQAPKIGTPGLNSADALYNNSARYQNIQTLASDLMTEAHDRITENF